MHRKESKRRHLFPPLSYYYIWEFYDVLHTESRETVTEDILKTLKIWEEKAGISIK